MYICFADIGLIVFCACVTYIIHEVMKAAQDYLEEKGWIA